MSIGSLATPRALAERFDEIPLSRICFSPLPGEATEAEVVRRNEEGRQLYELVDGTLIEKVMGTYESLIAGRILTLFNNYLDTHHPKPGLALPADGMLRLRVQLIHIPDASFIARDRLRPGVFPRHGVARVAPTIAVEVISEGNTPREMDEKLAEYFEFGAAEVWYIYPDTKSLLRYTTRRDAQTLTELDTLTTPILPGFACRLAALFVHPDEEFGGDLPTASAPTNT